MKVVSLFDGMSCGYLALKNVGVEIEKYYASEIDKKAMLVSKANFNNINQIGDVRDVNMKGEDIDLVIGGSPCQSFSRSGDGTGFDGKSSLFWEYVRVLNESNPKYFLLENVVMKKDWENIISKELGVSPILIDSKLVSAQKRQRLYWTNIPNIEQPKDMNIHIRDIFDNNPKQIFEYENDFLWFEDGEFRVKNATKKGFLTVNDFDVVNLDFPKSNTRRGRVSVGKSNTLNTSCNQAIFLKGKLLKLSSLECRRLQTIPDDLDFSMLSDNEIKKICGNGWTVKVIEHIFKNLK